MRDAIVLVGALLAALLVPHGAVGAPTKDNSAAPTGPTQEVVSERLRRDGMLVGGMVITIAGIAAAGVAPLLVTLHDCDDDAESHCEYPARTAGIFTGVGGAALLAVGIPLWVAGKKKVSAREATWPQLRLGPGTLTWTGTS